MQTSRTAQQSAKRGGTLKTERIATGQVRSCPAKLNAQQRPQAAKDLRTSQTPARPTASAAAGESPAAGAIRRALMGESPDNMKTI